MEQHDIDTAAAVTPEADISSAKRAFINNLSHDIRTPMNAVIGYTTLAAQNVHDPVRVGAYLEKIKTSSIYLSHLIEDVLDMSRIQGGEMTLEDDAVDLVAMMEGLMTVCQSQCDSKDVSLTLDVSQVRNRVVLCDELRLNQILLNLLSNAAKFTPSGGHVRLTVTQQESGEARCVYLFSVRDDGIGMAPDFLRHVFEPFAREYNSTACGIPGAGLGLSITKNLVDKMGGTITVDSELGLGTEFIITLLLPLAESCPQDSTVGEETAAAGRRVLLVEDNEMNREIACELLSEYGCQVTTAADGAEALELVRQTPPEQVDVILMDIQMPVMDGYAATRAIRALPDPDRACIPIVALTANSIETDGSTAREAGMNAYLTKPLNVAKLLQTLAEI